MTNNWLSLRKLACMALLLALAGCGDSDEEATEVVGDAVTTTTTTTTATEEPASPATEAEEPEIDAAAIATSFMQARDAYDFETTLALLDEDAAILDFGFWPREPAEYQGLFDFWALHNWSWDLEECTASSNPSGVVRCSYLIENDWSRAQGVDPVPGFHDIVVSADGLVVEVTRDVPEWRPVFGQWADWLVQNHAEDVKVLYRHDDEDRLTGGPATTPEALELFEQYLAEYMEWEETGS